MKRSKDKKAIRAGLKFLADTLDKLPDDEAAEIFNAIMAAYDEAAENQPSAAPAYNLAFVLAPAMTKADPGRPNKENAPAPTLTQLIAEPERRARIEAILRSEAIEKPANVAHLARAIERLKWTRWQEGSPKDFHTIAAGLIGTQAGSYDGFNSALQRSRSDKQKSNENYTTAKAVQRFIELLQADEI